MAEEKTEGKGTIDLTQELGKIAAEAPEVPGVLEELGFEQPDPAKTVLEACVDAGVDASIVALALLAEGYDVEGYESEDGGVAARAFDTVLTALFDPTSDLMPDASGSDAPMLAHMEAAVRRAQREGNLPGCQCHRKG